MKVFLSSTAVDLVAYRQVADDTILRLSQQAVAMERFGPLPGTPVEECERLARASDVTVCIVAHRYGFEPEKGRGSITRREVEAAMKAGKDVLVWIVADEYPWTGKQGAGSSYRPDGAGGAIAGGRCCGGCLGTRGVQGLAAEDLRVRHVHHARRTGSEDRGRPVEPLCAPDPLVGASSCAR